MAETDHQLDLLKQKFLAQFTTNKSSRQPAATNTSQNAGQADQSWLQKADLDAADAFLNQLDDTPAKGASDSQHIAHKPSKAAKKRKPAQLWFMMPEQKWQHLDVSKVSYKQSSDEPLGESSVTSFSESDSSVKNSRQHKRPKKCKLKSGMFARHTSTIKKPQLWPHNHLDSHFISNMPKFQDISWDQLVAEEVAIILQARGRTHSGNLQKVHQLYMAVVRAIEEGESSWSINFQMLEVLVIGYQTRVAHKSSKPIFDTHTESKDSKNVLFCKKYQLNECQVNLKNNTHWGTLRGKSCLLHHMCATCLLKCKKLEHHHEKTSDCPLFNKD